MEVNMKKVMHVIHGLSTGGAETLVKDYVLKLDKKKYSVVVLCFNHCFDSPYEKILKDNNIKVLYMIDYMSKKGKKGIILKIYKRVKLFFLVRKYIRKEKPDIIHGHLAINRFILFSNPNKKTKLFYTVHTEPNVLWRKRSFERKLEFISAKLLVKKYSMRFIVLHDEMKKEVDSIFKVNNSIVLNNGIDFERFDKKVINNNVRIDLGIPSNSFVIGHIGRFAVNKNQDFLVDIFYEIYKNNKNAFLLLIGSGKEKQRIQDKLDNLCLNNNSLILSNRSDVPDLLAIMDVFVFPSMFEGLGIVLIEAQKMNIPCFISDVVPQNASISNLITRISLEKKASEWAEIIINYKKPKKIILNDSDWDMNEIVKKLGDIYLDKI